jgi:hypothetical protein
MALNCYILPSFWTTKINFRLNKKRRYLVSENLLTTETCHRAQSPSTKLEKVFVHTSAPSTFLIHFDSLQLPDTHAISRGLQQPEKASDNLTPYSRLRHLIGFRKPPRLA